MIRILFLICSIKSEEPEYRNCASKCLRRGRNLKKKYEILIKKCNIGQKLQLWLIITIEVKNYNCGQK